ncbi:NUDIX domain-containing protein [Streptomyces sp. NPDC002671]
MPCHATAGAILVDASHRVLHIQHLATGKWLLPGGHLEPADNTLLQAAGRELTEEISSLTSSPHTARHRSTSTSTPSTPTRPRANPPSSTSTSASFSAPPPTSASSRPRRSPPQPGATSAR